MHVRVGSIFACLTRFFSACKVWTLHFDSIDVLVMALNWDGRLSGAIKQMLQEQELRIQVHCYALCLKPLCNSKFEPPSRLLAQPQF